MRKWIIGVVLGLYWCYAFALEEISGYLISVEGNRLNILTANGRESFQLVHGVSVAEITPDGRVRRKGSVELLRPNQRIDIKMEKGVIKEVIIIDVGGDGI